MDSAGTDQHRDGAGAAKRFGHIFAAVDARSRVPCLEPGRIAVPLEILGEYPRIGRVARRVAYENVLFGRHGAPPMAAPAADDLPLERLTRDRLAAIEVAGGHRPHSLRKQHSSLKSDQLEMIRMTMKPVIKLTIVPHFIMKRNRP